MMHSNLEFKILRGLAVIGLAMALFVVASIALDSGVIGGGGSVSESPAEAQAGAVPPTETPADAEGTPAPAAEQAATSGEQATTTPASAKSYVVEDGDSFYSISRKFNTSIADIQQLNPNLDPSNLSPGTRITVP